MHLHPPRLRFERRSPLRDDSPLRYAMISDVVAIARLRTLAESSSERRFVKEMLFWQFNVLPESRESQGVAGLLEEA